MLNKVGSLPSSVPGGLADWRQLQMSRTGEFFAEEVSPPLNGEGKAGGNKTSKPKNKPKPKHGPEGRAADKAIEAGVEGDRERSTKTPRPWLSLSKAEGCTVALLIRFDERDSHMGHNMDLPTNPVQHAAPVPLKQVQVKCNGVLQRQKHCEATHEVSVDNLQRDKWCIVEARVRSAVLDWSAWSAPLTLVPVSECDPTTGHTDLTWKAHDAHSIRAQAEEYGSNTDGASASSRQGPSAHGSSVCAVCSAAPRGQSTQVQTDENEAQTSLSFNPEAIITFLTRMASPQTSSAALPGFLEEVPSEFVCPITMEIMEDPVIATDGHAYEKEAIESWFEKSDRSPKTNEPLETKQLVRSHTLRAIIKDYTDAHPYAEPVVLL